MIAGVWVGWSAATLSKQAIDERASNQLLSVRETKSEIERYLTRVAGQLVTLANMVSTVEAMEGLTQAYQAYPLNRCQLLRSLP
ncbi:hypothetical protein HND97_14445 [Vibrio cholerae]|nr:hypothetical protein HND97_14445 [Vibrio cholerae]